MSELVFNEDRTKGQLKDVVFAYCKLQDGGYKYQSKTEKEYCVDCIIDKKTAKAFKKVFPKNGYKEIETQEFKDKYKIDPIYPEEDEQFLIKLKANANVRYDIPKCGLKGGDLVPYEWTTRPKAYTPVDGGVKDVTMDTLIGNGSIGTAGFNITENDFGRFPQLTGILVTDLIEYEQQGNMSEFGNVVGGYNPGDGNPQQVAITDKLTEESDSLGDDSSGTTTDGDLDGTDLPF